MSFPLADCRDMKQGGEKMKAAWWRRQGADGKETNGVPVSEVVMCRGKNRVE